MKKAIVYVVKNLKENKMQLLAQSDSAEDELLTLHNMMCPKETVYAVKRKEKKTYGRKVMNETSIVIVDENNNPDANWQFICKLSDVDKDGTSIDEKIVKDPKLLTEYYALVNRKVAEKFKQRTEETGEKS